MTGRLGHGFGLDRGDVFGQQLTVGADRWGVAAAAVGVIQFLASKRGNGVAVDSGVRV